MKKAFGVYKGTTSKDRKPKKWHRVYIENLIGIILPKESEIHHVDYNRANNDPSNLVVCPDRSYHKLLHKRQEVLEAGYNPDKYQKCTDCLDFLPLHEFHKNRARISGYSNICKLCSNGRNKTRYGVLKLSL